MRHRGLSFPGRAASLVRVRGNGHPVLPGSYFWRAIVSCTILARTIVNMCAFAGPGKSSESREK